MNKPKGTPYFDKKSKILTKLDLRKPLAQEVDMLY